MGELMTDITDPGRCPWCNRESEGNPGDYYHEKQCHRWDVLRRMEELELGGGTPEQWEALERELGKASYTGD